MSDSKSKKGSNKKNTAKSSFNMDEMTLFPKRADWRNKTLPDGTKVTSAMPHPKALEKVKESAKTIQSETKAGRPYSNAANQARRVGAVNKHIVQPGGLAKVARRGSVPAALGVAAEEYFRRKSNSNSSSSTPKQTTTTNTTTSKPTSTGIRVVDPNYMPKKTGSSNQKKFGGKISRKFKCGGKMKKK